MYVYVKSEPGLWTVGFYAPDDEWHPDSDHSDREEAANRVAYLKGGGPQISDDQIKRLVRDISYFDCTERTAGGAEERFLNEWFNKMRNIIRNGIMYKYD